MKIDLNAPWSCDNPILIAGKPYTITTGNGVGGTLSPVSIALASRVAALSNLGACCDFGCGLGLVGMAALQNASAVTLLDSDLSACDLTRRNVTGNGIAANVFSDQSQIPNGSIDSIFGSEVVYPSYQINNLCGFIGRAWSRKGPCLLANSDGGFGFSLIARLHMLGLNASQSNEVFVLPNGDEIDYVLWTLAA